MTKDSITYGPYHATVVAIHDGDTFTLDIDLGFGMKIDLNCRVFGINAPEIATQAGKDALDFARQYISPGVELRVVSHGWDKYGGRFDGAVTLPAGQDFAKLMLDSGHAKPYSGRGPKT